MVGLKVGTGVGGVGAGVSGAPDGAMDGNGVNTTGTTGAVVISFNCTGVGVPGLGVAGNSASYLIRNPVPWIEVSETKIRWSWLPGYVTGCGMSVPVNVDSAF